MTGEFIIDLDAFVLPDAPIPAPFERKATEKQVAFMTSLLRDRQMPPEFADTDTTPAGLAALEREEASALIDGLLKSPRAKSLDSAGATFEEGFYESANGIFRVVRSQTGNLYAKRLDDSGWTYEPGAMRALVGAVRLTIEVAAQYGRRTGRCAICGRMLTVTESIERGIGPVCAERLGY